MRITAAVQTTGCPSALKAASKGKFGLTAALTAAHRLLHGKQCQDLKQVVLNDITDDAILVKVPATPLSAKVFTEDDLRTDRRAKSRG